MDFETTGLEADSAPVRSDDFAHARRDRGRITHCLAARDHRRGETVLEVRVDRDNLFAARHRASRVLVRIAVAALLFRTRALVAAIGLYPLLGGSGGFDQAPHPARRYPWRWIGRAAGAICPLR